MDKSKLSSNLQVALSALVANMVLIVLFDFNPVVSQTVGPSPPIILALDGSVVVLTLLFLPLLWWRNKAGYIGAIGVGTMALILGILALTVGFATGEIPVGLLPVLIVFIALSVVIIGTSTAAWREKT